MITRLEAILDSVNDLNQATEHLTGEVARLDRHNKEAKMRNRLLLFLVIVLALLTATMVGLYVTRTTSNSRIIREIQSCTNPKGECAKRGADSQKQALKFLDDRNVQVAWCAKSSATEEAYKSCVAQPQPKE